MCQVQKIPVLDEGLRSLQRGDDLRRYVPTTLFRAPGWSSVPRVTTLDLDVLVWMGARPTLHLTSTGLSFFPSTATARTGDHRSNTRFRDPPLNDIPGSSLPRR